jgi:hypothetical protein
VTTDRRLLRSVLLAATPPAAVGHYGGLDAASTRRSVLKMSDPRQPAKNESKETNKRSAEKDDGEQPGDATSRVETEDWAQHDPDTPDPPVKS